MGEQILERSKIDMSSLIAMMQEQFAAIDARLCRIYGVTNDLVPILVLPVCQDEKQKKTFVGSTKPTMVNPILLSECQAKKKVSNHKQTFVGFKKPTMVKLCIKKMPSKKKYAVVAKATVKPKSAYFKAKVISMKPRVVVKPKVATTMTNLKPKPNFALVAFKVLVEEWLHIKRLEEAIKIWDPGGLQSRP